MSYTRAQWATAMLQAAGNKNPDPKVVEWVVNWTRYETATGSGAAYNLLNTTQGAPGSSRFNSVGVQNFVTFAQGTQTNARVLANGRYPTLLDALKNNKTAPLGISGAPSAAVNKQLSIWGTGAKAAIFAQNLGAGMNDQFSGVASGSAPAIQAGRANTYPRGQCTWWADERFHQLSGYYVPWSGNAKDWATLARKYQGWVVSNAPQAGAIIVLQPGVQGADKTFGHVAVVEQVNLDLSVRTSDQNWAGITYPNTTYVNFKLGAGVSFITVSNQSNSPIGSRGSTPEQSDQVAALMNAIGAFFGGAPFVPIDSVLNQVHTTLVDNPGFYGIALAIDEVNQFPGYQNLATGPFDVIGVIRSVGASVTDNSPAFFIRGTLVGLGLFILILLITKVALAVGEPVLQGASAILPLIGA